MYVVAGLNTGTEYYRAKYQSKCISLDKREHGQTHGIAQQPWRQH
ncbi:hypothetical protein [Lacticaseibacillus paracasei]